MLQCCRQVWKAAYLCNVVMYSGLYKSYSVPSRGGVSSGLLGWINNIWARSWGPTKKKQKKKRKQTYLGLGVPHGLTDNGDNVRKSRGDLLQRYRKKTKERRLDIHSCGTFVTPEKQFLSVHRRPAYLRSSLGQAGQDIQSTDLGVPVVDGATKQSLASHPK